MKSLQTFALIGFCLLMATTVCAQRGGGRPGGDAGRGGGPPGGGPGGFRGGPGGGFQGGGPGGGFQGGGPGGARGGDRGGRGGFDPSGSLSRLDANGNGVLDPDEQQGPAQFLIGRLQQADPSIKSGQPIPISKISEAFTRAREQRDAGGGNDPRSGGPSAADEALETELLVPGFGIEEEPVPLMGFGPTAELLAVMVTEADKREAAERMRRYDRNRDGFISKDELSSRFAGNPMDFDRNRDGKLSESELAVRYARRREGEELAREQRRDDDRRRDDQGGDREPPDPYSGRKSYRNIAELKSPEGIPGFFTDRDRDQDGQVTMAEYAGRWNDEMIAEYFKWDLNSDGVITASEAISAVVQGASASAASTMVSRSGSSNSSDDAAEQRSTTKSAAAGGGPVDPKLISYAERIVTRYDKNPEDGALTAGEWSSMLINPSPADANRDGRITIPEYAQWLQSRSKK